MKSIRLPVQLDARLEFPLHSLRDSTLKDPLLVTSGSFLCRVRIWNEEEWVALAEANRPVEFVHAPGLGWVGLIPIAPIN